MHKTKGQYNRAIATLDDQDKPAQVRIDMVSAILNHTTTYLDSIEERYTQDSSYDFESVEQEADKNGHIMFRGLLALGFPSSPF